MKIQYCSDLHLEFGPTSLPGGELLILAGDVAEARTIARHQDAFESLSDEEQLDAKYRALYRAWTFFKYETAKYEQVFMVMGNHCHYHGRFDRTYDELRAMLPANVRLLEKEVVEYGGVMFMGASLWTDINRGDPLTAQVLKSSMNDYKVTQCHYPDTGRYHKLTPEHTAKTHRATKRFFIETLLANPDQQFVIITHHAPSTMSIADQYKGDIHMNGGYASDLSEMILDHSQIKVWIHGHMHNQSDYLIGSTRILCNPRGYAGHESAADDFTVANFEITPAEFIQFS